MMKSRCKFLQKVEELLLQKVLKKTCKVWSNNFFGWMERPATWTNSATTESFVCVYSKSKMVAGTRDKDEAKMFARDSDSEHV